jgi:serine O-acetyltransferase
MVMVRSAYKHLSLVSKGASSLRDITDALWLRLREEAQEAYKRAPMLAPLFVDSILDQPSFEAAVFHRTSARLKNDTIPLSLLVETFHRAVAADPGIVLALRADIHAVVERDPACERFIEPFLYFKGFHAIQTHRLAHWLWNNQEIDFALYLQSRSRTCSRPTSIRRRSSAAASSWTMRPVWSWALPPWSRTTSRSFRT